jgi:hypothetical protein
MAKFAPLFLAVGMAAALSLASVNPAVAARHPDRQHDSNNHLWRTAAFGGLGYFLFPWSLLFAGGYSGIDSLEPIEPVEAPAKPAAAKGCVKSNIAKLANKCPAVAPKS